MTKIIKHADRYQTITATFKDPIEIGKTYTVAINSQPSEIKIVSITDSAQFYIAGATNTKTGVLYIFCFSRTENGKLLSTTLTEYGHTGVRYVSVSPLGYDEKLGKAVIDVVRTKQGSNEPVKLGNVIVSNRHALKVTYITANGTLICERMSRDDKLHAEANPIVISSTDKHALTAYNLVF